LFLILCTAVLNQAQAQAQEAKASVRAKLSQASMTLGDSVSLTVTAENMDEAIDLSPLEKLWNRIDLSQLGCSD